MTRSENAARKPHVVVPDHAWSQFQTRAWLDGAVKIRRPAQLQVLVEQCLYNEMRGRGLKMHGAFAVVEVRGLRTLLQLGRSAWVVVTFLAPGMTLKEASAGGSFGRAS